MRIRSRKGQGITEAVAAAFILIPIALCLFDFLVVIIANSMNDTACKNAARAAANQPTTKTAGDAAALSLQSLHSPLISNIAMPNVTYTPGVAVSVTTRITVHLPVPFPGYSDLTFDASDVEPIVGAPPPN
jgi:Flp pilus assembly protein TadG